MKFWRWLAVIMIMVVGGFAILSGISAWREQRDPCNQAWATRSALEADSDARATTIAGEMDFAARMTQIVVDRDPGANDTANLEAAYLWNLTAKPCDLPTYREMFNITPDSDMLLTPGPVSTRSAEESD